MKNSDKYMDSVLKTFPTLGSNGKIAIDSKKMRFLLQKAYEDGEIGTTKFSPNSDKLKIVFIEFDKFMENFSDSLGKFFEGVNKTLSR